MVGLVGVASSAFLSGQKRIQDEKSSCLSYNLVNSFPLLSISKCRSGHETEFTVSVVGLFFDTMPFIRWKLRLKHLAKRYSLFWIRSAIRAEPVCNDFLWPAAAYPVLEGFNRRMDTLYRTINTSYLIFKAQWIFRVERMDNYKNLMINMA